MADADNDNNAPQAQENRNPVEAGIEGANDDSQHGPAPPPGVDYNPLYFNPDEPAVSAPLVYPFQNFNYPIPNDLLELHRAGYQVPLSLLTVVSIVYHARGDRPAFNLPLDSTATRVLEEWVHTDKFLPFQEWIQASGIYLVLLENASASGHKEASVYANHLLRVVASVHGTNWDIFREYDFRVRSQHAAARRSMSRIGFNIRQLNQQLLGLAAGAVRPDGGANGIIDITGDVATPWARLISSPYPDRARIARAWSSTAAVPSAPPPPAATSTSTSPKRKVPRVGGAFGPSTAPTTSFGPAPSFPSGPTSWCPVCCTWTDTHKWKSCISPANPLLCRVGYG